MAKASKTAPKQRRGTGHNNNGNPDKLKGHTFRDRPERINKNGRPRKYKSLSQIREYLQSKHGEGYEGVSKSQWVDTYAELRTATRDELVAIKNDSDAPNELRMVADALLDPKQFRVMWEILMDREWGKAQQYVRMETQEVSVPVATGVIPPEQQAVIDELTKTVNEDIQSH